MSNKRKPKYVKPGKSKLVPVLIIIAAVLAVVLIGMILFVRNTQGGSLFANDAVAPSGKGQSGADGESEAATTLPVTVQFPYAFENDSLEITSLFQYSGFNPDCNWGEGTDVGAVVFVNKSEKYLETLDLTVIMTDGTVLSFMIADIPAGKTVWAFESSNQEYDDTVAVTEVQYEAKFREDEGLAPELVTVAAETMNITLTNVSAEDLAGLEVRCHGILDGVYFGGTSYTYPVETIPAGGSTVVFAEDCFLGETEATLVDYTN